MLDAQVSVDDRDIVDALPVAREELLLLSGEIPAWKISDDGIDGLTDGDERQIIKELIRKLVEERTFQFGFERALQAFGISKESTKSSKFLDANLDATSIQKGFLAIEC